jgi:hypothetical protein
MSSRSPKDVRRTSKSPKKSLSPKRSPKRSLSPKKSYLENLPKEMQHEIFSNLRAKDFWKIKSTSKKMLKSVKDFSEKQREEHKKQCPDYLLFMLDNDEPDKSVFFTLIGKDIEEAFRNFAISGVKNKKYLKIINEYHCPDDELLSKNIDEVVEALWRLYEFNDIRLYRIKKNNIKLPLA